MGGRADIIQAAKLIANEVRLDKLSLEEISDETIFKY